MANKIEITIKMDDNGSLSVVGNVTGAHLVGMLELSKASVLKDMMDGKKQPVIPNSIPHPEKLSKEVSEKHAAGEQKIPGDGKAAEDALINQEDKN